jgi:hypothetical protein
MVLACEALFIGGGGYFIVICLAQFDVSVPGGGAAHQKQTTAAERTRARVNSTALSSFLVSQSCVR